jgi:hypothetical protein
MLDAMIVTPDGVVESNHCLTNISFLGVDFLVANSSLCDLDLSTSYFPQYKKGKMLTRTLL